MIKLIRKILKKRNYLLLNENFIPKGHYLISDINRLVNSKSVNVVLDIGAHEGYVTQELLNLFPNSDIFSIEPSTKSFKLLESKFENNNKVKTHNFGIGIKDEIKVFKIFENHELNTFSSEIGFDESNSISEEKVNLKSLDSFFYNNILINEKNGIDFIKIDVEGFEMNCLHGAERLLQNNQIGMFFIEVGFSINDNRHTPFETIKSFLEKYNFTIYALYDLYHYRKKTELLFANALFINEDYLKNNNLLIK
jgi:FkbM family methyltransferase